MESLLHTGDGPPVLLLHSGFCTWVEWRHTAALLEDRREVLAPTLAGSLGGARLDVRDRTMLQALADDAERILDEAGWDEPVPVVGSSFGGIVAIELATRGRASKVLALAPPWPAGAGIAYYLGLFSPIFGMRAVEWMYPYSSKSRRLTSLFFHQSLVPMELDPADARELWISAGRFPLIEVGRRSGGRGPGQPDLTAVSAPVTFVWGTRDLFVPGWMHRRWEQALPQADVETLEGFPHQPHLRDSHLIAQRILAHSEP